MFDVLSSHLRVAGAEFELRRVSRPDSFVLVGGVSAHHTSAATLSEVLFVAVSIEAYLLVALGTFSSIESGGVVLYADLGVEVLCHLSPSS